MRITITCAFLLFCTACNKEECSKWEVEFSDKSDTEDHMVLVHEDDFNKDKNPFSFEYGSANILWGEQHIIQRNKFWGNSSYRKHFFLEIPDSTGITGFSFQDEEIYDSLKCGVWQFYSNTIRDGFYRLHNGTISGQKAAGEWTIDFDVYYGGKDGMKYRMKQGAQY